MVAISNGEAGLSVRGKINRALGALVGHVAGRWYLASDAPVAQGGNFTTNNARMLPFVLTETITISDLGARVATLAAGGNFQLAIYASDAATFKPTGNALAATGDISTAATGAVSADITGSNVQLTPGLYWMAVCVDATAGGVAVFQTFATSSPALGYLIGSTTHANLIGANGSVALHYSVSMTYGTWPDMTSATFTETVNSTAACALHFKVASVP